jgi:hypothetical protein
VSESALREAIANEPALANWHIDDVQPVSSGFYTSTAVRLVRA